MFMSNAHALKQPQEVKKPLRIVGRHVHVELPAFGIPGTIAKVDTGAYRSALHATNIKVVKDVLYFDVSYQSDEGKLLHKTVSTKKYGDIRVKNSSGSVEHRYRVEVVAIIDGQEYDMEVTLTNRGTMKYPLLLGRRVLRGNFLVDVDLQPIISEDK